MAERCLMLRAVIKTVYLSLNYLKSLPKAMKLSSMKQQSMRKSMPMRKGARVLSCGIVIKDHGVISPK